MSSRRALLAAMAALAFAVPPSGPAGAGERETRDHDTVRAAVQRGDIRPLADILAALRGKLPGNVIGVEIEQKHGHWVYEFRTSEADGRLFEVYVDARSAEIERIEEK